MMDEVRSRVGAGEVDALIKEVLTGKRDWRVLARIILEYERNSLWKGTSNSFSAWLKKFASELGIQIANLWRFRRAAKAAFVFWGDQGQRCVFKIMDIPEGISPESIEILEKISRAAPAYLVKDLAARLWKKELPISELRMLWKKFRPALEGDARGRGKLTPALSRSDLRRRASLLEDLAVEALGRLEAKDISCSGCEARIKVLRNLVVKDGYFEMDIAMIVGGEMDDVEIHGVEVLSQVFPEKLQFLQNLKRYCDYVWVAFSDSPTAEMHSCLDADIGLIQIRELHADVIRKANRSTSELGGKMARSIINKLME